MEESIRTSVAVVIPARLKSTRFPEKPLALIRGREMILYVAEVAGKAVGRERTYVATDSNRIAQVVRRAGYSVVLTSERALTGTDRVSEASKNIPVEILVNVQGDEPLLDPEDIRRIIRVKQEYPDHVINGMHPISDREDPESVNIPKVVVNESDDLIYMSRRALPGYKDLSKRPSVYLKQVCIYAYTRQQLQAFSDFRRKSTLEEHEDIEILRFLDLKIPVKMVMTGQVSVAVVVPSDIEEVEKILTQQSGEKGTPPLSPELQEGFA